GRDDRSAAHHLREPPCAEDDAVDVHAHRPAVVIWAELREIRLCREDSGVEDREVDGIDGFPCDRIGDVEAVDEIERLDVIAFALEARAHRAAEAAFTACDERLHGSSTTLPTCARDSISAWAPSAS